MVSLKRKRVIINIIEKELRERRMERIRNPILLTKEMRRGINLILVKRHQGSMVVNIVRQFI